jgi:hypothetical protein
MDADEAMEVDSDVEEIPQAAPAVEEGAWNPDQSIEERRDLRKEYRTIIEQAEGLYGVLTWQAPQALRQCDGPIPRTRQRTT